MRNKRYIGFLALVLVSLAALSSWFYYRQKIVQPALPVVSGAKLYFLPEDLAAGVGEEFTVALRIDPAGKRVTAQELYLSFNPDLVSLRRVSASTAFSVVLKSAEIDNKAGRASIVVGVPPTSPVKEDSDVLYLSFVAKDKVGEGAIKVEDNSQAAAIGMAANVLEGFGALPLRIKTK